VHILVSQCLFYELDGAAEWTNNNNNNNNNNKYVHNDDFSDVAQL
jgi:hypothetical protein